MYRRSFIAAAAAFLVAGPAAAQTLVVTASGSLNLRSGPGTNYPVIGQISRGAAVEQLEARSGWVRVKTQNGLTGWAAASYLGTQQQGGKGPQQGNQPAQGQQQPAQQQPTQQQPSQPQAQAQPQAQIQSQPGNGAGAGSTMKVRSSGGLNLRSGPGTNYGVVLQLRSGQSVTVLETNGSWLRIRLGDGTTGWALGSYLGQ